MQTITTKYIPATNTKPTRISATASGNNSRIVISSDGMSEASHILAVKTLCEQNEWDGELIGGHTKTGMVFVFDDAISPRLTLPSIAK